MNIPSKYNPGQTEEKWYTYWMEQGFFRSVPDEREPYCIVIPPPNVTGVLHMGHMLNNTIQDVLVRRARMQGKNTLWLPGTDHASIATEAKVVARLKEDGIDKSEITREEFMQYAWEWKDKHGGIILEQLKKLGASCDWERTRFTMDEALYESVIDVFIDLYNKGLIYQGVRMVNWDPKALTALSDEEVIFKEVQSKLYYLRYKVEGSDDDWVTIATTRPETILGDTAVCINPNDDRFKHLLGKRVLVPLINRSVPIIKDDYVDMEFGTGCLKITPAHDINDYEIGIRHKLDTIDIFNDNGTLNKSAELYIGEDRFEARDKILEDLEKAGHIVKIEDYVNKVGYSERTDVVIEPKLSLQWFLKMEELAKPALEVVIKNTVKFHPAKFKNTYRHWMENVRDWCISRQLWWGQQIPAYYLPNKEIVVAKTKEEAFELAKQKFNLPDLKIDELKQDEDVLDTWFSSWLWPISVFDGIRYPDNDDIKYYYPTNDLVTAPEILFFWVARMIMAGLEYRGDIPFKNVYLTGIVRDKLGRKMSKSLGNSPDPIELMNKFGADGVRVGMLLTSPAGNDLPFDDVLCEQGRNFSNKIWNALRLIKGWNVDENIEQPEYCFTSAKWFDAKMNAAIGIIDDHFSKYRISDALMSVYKLIWDDFCSWYLEMIKPGYQKSVDKVTYERTIGFFEDLMKLLHPFMPFISEEIWHHLREREKMDCIIVARMPESKKFDKSILEIFNIETQVIIAIRNLRKEKNIPNKESVELFIKKNYQQEPDHAFDSIISKLCNLSAIKYVDEKVAGAASFIVKSTEFYVPLASSVDVEAAIRKLEEELEYTKGFLNSVMKKLSNERFVNNAPEAVVEKERNKQADAEGKIKVIEEQIAALK
ncbi:MAG: valine--tRNA ligase [Bacteroidetes bacterium]|nr:valine--tRNA ligase [Bacteroidota bacterium]MBL7105083.1 valine--tRNA ligase [Bacteroidales bacterium]